MSKPDLVFLTRENDKAIRKKLAPQVLAEVLRKEREFNEANEKEKLQAKAAKDVSGP